LLGAQHSDLEDLAGHQSQCNSWREIAPRFLSWQLVAPISALLKSRLAKVLLEQHLVRARSKIKFSPPGIPFLTPTRTDNMSFLPLFVCACQKFPYLFQCHVSPSAFHRRLSKGTVPAKKRSLQTTTLRQSEQRNLSCAQQTLHMQEPPQCSQYGTTKARGMAHPHESLHSLVSGRNTCTSGSDANSGGGRGAGGGGGDANCDGSLTVPWAKK